MKPAITKAVLTVVAIMLITIFPARAQQPGARANAQGGGLINAVREGDLPRVKALLAAHADVNAKDSLGETALIAASWLGRLEVVRALLAAFYVAAIWFTA